MLVLQVALGNVPRGVWLDPRLHYKRSSPRLSAKLPQSTPLTKTTGLCSFDAGSLMRSLRIIHSAQKPVTMSSFHHPLGGHCHGTNPLFLPARARCSDICLPAALLAVAHRRCCPSPADRALPAPTPQPLQAPPPC